jgi:hypothetical protein
MTAYRDVTDSCLVDAEKAPVGITVQRGPHYSSETITTRGQWIVLTPGSGYEVWPEPDFIAGFKRVTGGREARVERMIADTSRLRRIARDGLLR